MKTARSKLFDKVIKPSANVKMVFSGHTGAGGYRADETAGGKVYAFLQCYHDRTTNPVRLVEIDTEAGTINTRVYCPMTDETKADGAVKVDGVKWVKSQVAEPVLAR